MLIHVADLFWILLFSLLRKNEKRGMKMRLRYHRMGYWKFYFNTCNTFLKSTYHCRLSKYESRSCSLPHVNVRFQLVADLLNHIQVYAHSEHILLKIEKNISKSFNIVNSRDTICTIYAFIFVFCVRHTFLIWYGALFKN